MDTVALYGTVLCFLLLPAACALTPVRYLADFCQVGKVHMNDSLVLKLTHDLVSDRFLFGYLHCSVDVMADTGLRLYIHFLSLDISDQANTPDRLHIYDFNDEGLRVRVTPPTGLYGVLERPYYEFNTAGIRIKDYKSSSNKLRLDYLGKPTFMYEGFKVLITVYTRPSRSGKCPANYFLCKTSKICIPANLRCDKQPNCGESDGSDEQRCHEHAEMVTSLEESYSAMHAVTVALVACAVFLLSIGLVALFVMRYNKRREFRRQSIRVLASRNADGVCTISSDLDELRLYAPPSYEDVVAQINQTSDPPPEYSSLGMAARGKLSDEEETEEEFSSRKGKSPRGKSLRGKSSANRGGGPKRSQSVQSVGVAIHHDRSRTPEHLRQSPSDPNFHRASSECLNISSDGRVIYSRHGKESSESTHAQTDNSSVESGVFADIHGVSSSNSRESQTYSSAGEGASTSSANTSMSSPDSHHGITSCATENNENDTKEKSRSGNMTVTVNSSRT